MGSAQLEMTVRESPEAVAAALVAFDVFVRGRKRRHQHGERQKFQVAVAKDLFCEEVEGRQHAAQFGARAANSSLWHLRARRAPIATVCSRPWPAPPPS